MGAMSLAKVGCADACDRSAARAGRATSAPNASAETAKFRRNFNMEWIIRGLLLPGVPLVNRPLDSLAAAANRCQREGYCGTHAAQEPAVRCGGWRAVSLGFSARSRSHSAPGGAHRSRYRAA